jgi:hypothetical protein
VETTGEIHLFPYGYLQHAKLSRTGNCDVVEVQFQNATVIAKGKRLESLCDALARFAVERIKMRPEKYEGLSKSEEIIESIEIKKTDKRELSE